MITKKEQRRAVVRLLDKAETLAKETQISLADAMLNILESGDDFETSIKAFAQIKDTKRHQQSEKQRLSDYLDATS